jgi:hypothetical protein
MTVEMGVGDGPLTSYLPCQEAGVKDFGSLASLKLHDITSRLPAFLPTPDCLRPVACYFIPWVWDLFSLLYVIVGAQLHARSYARSHATASAQLHAHNEK